jgi:RHS repeat-associated protein
VNPVTTHYLVDPNHAYAQVIEEAEQQGSAAPTVKALYAVGDDRIRRYTPAVAGSGGGPSIPAGLRYYHADGLGSTRLLTDDTAAVTDQLTYEAFGELDAAASVQTSDNAFMYTGEQFDPNSGFYYLRARYMDPGNGRFTQQDGFEGFKARPLSIAKYLYADGNPVSGVDPSGNMTLGEVSQATHIQNGARSTSAQASRKALDTASRARVIKIFVVRRLVPIPHWFVVAEGPYGNYRYDFGPQSLLLSPFPLPGVLQMSTYRKLAFVEQKIKIVTRLNFMQWMIWSKAVLNTVNIDMGMPLNEGIAPDYCLFGSNCRTLVKHWVKLAIAEAKIVERVLK